MSQYALDLALPPHFSDDNFFVSDCNREAKQWISRWPDWPSHALLLFGPQGSGKTHLGHLWMRRAKAVVVTATQLGEPPQGNALVEDIEMISDPKPLLHWLNAAKENGDSLLLTSTLPAAQLPFSLPDLTSRLKALPAAEIGQPDDNVLAGAMRKQFSDRQMKVEEEVITYLVSHMERSLTQALLLVERIDRSALEKHRAITVPFVRTILESA